MEPLLCSHVDENVEVTNGEQHLATIANIFCKYCILEICVGLLRVVKLIVAMPYVLF